MKTKQNLILLTGVALILLMTVSVLAWQWPWQVTGQVTKSTQLYGPVKVTEGKNSTISVQEGQKCKIGIASISTNGVTLVVNDKQTQELQIGSLYQNSYGFKVSVTKIYYSTRVGVKNYVIVKCGYSPVCTDSDGGMDYFRKGTTKGINSMNSEAYTKGDTITITDVCSSENHLKEYYCMNNTVDDFDYDCPKGCVDEACVEEVSVIRLDKIAIGDEKTLVYNAGSEGNRAFIVSDNIEKKSYYLYASVRRDLTTLYNTTTITNRVTGRDVCTDIEEGQTCAIDDTIWITPDKIKYVSAAEKSVTLSVGEDNSFNVLYAKI